MNGLKQRKSLSINICKRQVPTSELSESLPHFSYKWGRHVIIFVQHTGTSNSLMSVPPQEHPTTLQSHFTPQV